MKTYVYIIECRTDESSSSNPVKIGYTSNIKKRIGELQVGNPSLLVLLAAVAYETEQEAAKKEAHYHKMFNRHSIRGEWFKPVVMQGAAMAHFSQLSFMQQRDGKVPDIAKMYIAKVTQTKTSIRKNKRKWARKKK